MVDADSTDPVPPHLRDAHYAGAAKLGHGEGYEYPHDFEGHHVKQQYRPERFEDTSYYEPSASARGPGRPGPARRSRSREDSSTTEASPKALGMRAERSPTPENTAPKKKEVTDDAPGSHGGETALIVLAAFWGLLVLFSASCSEHLPGARGDPLTVDAMREETVPLLRRSRVPSNGPTVISIGSVTSSTPSAARGRVERLDGLIEHAAARPIMSSSRRRRREEGRRVVGKKKSRVPRTGSTAL